MSITITEARTVIAETEAVDRGWRIYRRAIEAEWPGDGKAIDDAAGDLAAAWKLYGEIRDDVTSPEEAFAELEGEPDAFARALQMAAEDVTRWADEVVRLLPAAAEGGETA